MNFRNPVKLQTAVWLAPPGALGGLEQLDEAQGEVGVGSAGVGMKKFLARPSAMIHRCACRKAFTRPCERCCSRSAET